MINVRRTFYQFLKYVLVGGLSFAVDSGLLYVLVSYVGLHYLLAASISFVCGLVVNYLLAILWVFDESKRDSRKIEFTIYALIGLTGLILNDVVIYAITEGAGFHYMISKVITAAIILIWNFSLRRHFLFR